MTTDVGCDVAVFQPPHILMTVGEMLFAFVKLSEGTGPSNRNFGTQWADALRFFKRGTYHYGRPHSSDGVHQAAGYADLCMSAGFKPGVDMWMLDAEGLGNDVKALGNEAVTGPQWAAFTVAFMDYCLQRLGPLGFLYVGGYFFPADFGPLTHKYNWMLPNYGSNDGSVHALPAGVNPVLHQFTSARGLDRTIVHDLAKWKALTGAPLQPGPPRPTRKDNRVLSVSGLPVLDENHNPYIDIVDGGKAICCFFGEPFADGPQVKSAFGLQTFSLAAGEVAIDLAPYKDGVLVRLSNNEAHYARCKSGLVIR